MSQPITELLTRLSRGDRSAGDELTPLVYERLREIAARQLGDEDARQFDATEIVHEAYLKLLGPTPIAWTDRTHFFATASKVIRQVLVDAARRRKRLKRGGDAVQETLREAVHCVGHTDGGRQVELLALDQALNELARRSPRQAQLVEMRFFGGLTQDEAAEALGVSRRTVAGDWAMARAWLQHELNENP